MSSAPASGSAPVATLGPSRRGWLHYVAIVLAVIFGGVFVWSGFLKAQDPGAFIISVRSFRILHDPYAAWLALFLPWLEIFAGLAVITGLGRRGGLLLLNLSLVMFAIALVSAWSRGIDVDCGCFGGKDSETQIVDALVRDVVLLAVGGWLMLRKRGK